MWKNAFSCSKTSVGFGGAAGAGCNAGWGTQRRSGALNWEKTNALKKPLTGGRTQRGPGRETSQVFSLAPCKVGLCAEENGLITSSNGARLVPAWFYFSYLFGFFSSCCCCEAAVAFGSQLALMSHKPGSINQIHMPSQRRT